MTENEVCTYTVDIFIAGDLGDARRICREFCTERGFCVTVAEAEFIYTGGAENGVRVGCINYPRFPARPEQIWAAALELAERLRTGLCRHSFCLIAPDMTYWRSYRK
jgi:hypothetical protein